jgi:hypothetical protein
MLKCENTDIEHDGYIYHVQTEDWGPENPYLVTRVFRGGKVLTSVKTNYNSWLSLDSESRISKLKKILTLQHLEFVEKVKEGHF